MNRSWIRTAAWTLALSTGLAWGQAPTFQVGQPLPALTIQNQHQRAWGWDDSTRLVILAKGRKPANWVMEVVGAQGNGFLASRQAVYVADMSKMPGFVTRTFALPALREQPFEVGVVMDDQALAAWPQQADTLTVIYLDRGRVVRHESLTDAAGLRRVLGL